MSKGFKLGQWITASHFVCKVNRKYGDGRTEPFEQVKGYEACQCDGELMVIGKTYRQLGTVEYMQSADSVDGYAIDDERTPKQLMYKCRSTLAGAEFLVLPEHMTSTIID